MDPFATLGLARRYDIDKAALDRRYRELQQTLHPDRHATASASERALTLSKAVAVNEAYRILRDDYKRGEALLTALGAAVSDKPADPELLMEMMELREELADARAAGEAAQVARLASAVEQKAAAARGELASAFATLEKQPDQAPPPPAALQLAQSQLARLRYYRRFQDEVAQFEDDALA
ncbi:MAG: Fe-S protein assembly co-chaperone HscB [Polyangiales bacterium]